MVNINGLIMLNALAAKNVGCWILNKVFNCKTTTVVLQLKTLFFGFSYIHFLL